MNFRTDEWKVCGETSRLGGARLLRFGASRVEIPVEICAQTRQNLEVSANCSVYDDFPTSQLGLQEQTGGGPGRNRL